MRLDPTSNTSPVHHYIPDPDDAPNFMPNFEATPDLEYRGGKILSNPSFVSLYYGPYWKTGKGLADASYEDGFAKYLVKSRYTSIWAEYGVGKGKFIGSNTFTTAATPKSVNDILIRRLISRQIDSSAVPKPDGNTVYTIFLPPGMILTAPGNVTSLDGLGGYHGSYDYGNGKRVYYAVIVYSNGSNGINFDNKPRDNISITASHEWIEAATDPDVNNGELGWYDENLGEIADIPINQGLPLSEVFGRLGKYAVQKLWSNVDGRNELSARHPGKVTPPNK